MDNENIITFTDGGYTFTLTKNPFLDNVENPFIIKPKKNPKDKLNKPNPRWMSFNQKHTIIDKTGDFPKRIIIGRISKRL